MKRPTRSLCVPPALMAVLGMLCLAGPSAAENRPLAAGQGERGGPPAEVRQLVQTTVAACAATAAFSECRELSRQSRGGPMPTLRCLMQKLQSGEIESQSACGAALTEIRTFRQNRRASRQPYARTFPKAEANTH